MSINDCDNDDYEVGDFNDEFKGLLKLPPILRHPIPGRNVPYCLGFEKCNNHGYYRATPNIPYRIKGLLIWGADCTTLITKFQVANIECLKAGKESIPAMFFSTGYSFEDFKSLLKDPGSIIYGGLMFAIPRHFPFQEVIDRTLSIADQITIQIEGPFTQLITWGYTIE